MVEYELDYPFVIFFATYFFMDRFLTVEDKLERSPIVFVPGGNWIMRIPTALPLLKQNWADQIYICQSVMSKSRKELLERYGSKVDSTKYQIMNILVREGIEKNKINFINRAYSTLEEMEILLEECRRRNFSKVIIVTDPLHTRRTKMLFNRVFKETDIKPILHPTYSRKEFHKYFAEGVDYKVAVFTETFKYFYYLFKL